MTPLIPVVIVCRNGLGLTKKAVKSILAQSVPMEVLLVDNASEDGTREWAKSKRDVTMIGWETQRSLAECWNHALKALWRVGYTEALVVNNDVEIHWGTVEALHYYSQSTGTGFVTCVSVNKQEQMKEYTGKDWNPRPNPDFSNFLISKEVTQKVGWFDEKMFPAYCEDSDYHVRMHRAGIHAVCIDLPFLHHGASTLKESPEGEQAKIRRGAQKNRERFFDLYGCFPGTPEYEALFMENSGK